MPNDTIPLPQPDAYEYLIAGVWRTETHFNGVKAKEYRCLYATEKVRAHAAAVSAEKDAEIAGLREIIGTHARIALEQDARIKVLEDALQAASDAILHIRDTHWTHWTAREQQEAGDAAYAARAALGDSAPTTQPSSPSPQS